ncbi:MAG TPA: RNA polymerase sigma factor [Candidatus Limnocylindrales bacterium]|nr:RNA polymerase sigma factor [Candidatus Limnocylindrales bacterium]
MSDLSQRTAHWTELGEALLPLVDALVASVDPAILLRDPQALVSALYDAHQQDLYSFARSAAIDPSLADDVVQEAFLRLVREVEAGRLPKNPGGWLFRVVANLIVSQARRRRTTLRARPLSRQSNLAPSAEQEMLERERYGDLGLRLRRLPTEGRVALLLAAQGVSGRDIAAALGRSETATRTILFRARRRLRAELEAAGAEEAGR